MANDRRETYRGAAAAIAAASILAGLAFRLRVASLPLDVLTSRYLADDYFYYLNVARHLAAGDGSTFDGITTTSGYQPLFLWLLVAVFKTGAGSVSAIRAGLVVQAVSAAAAAWAVYVLGARRQLPWAGALAASMLSMNLFFVLWTLTGFEMSLALGCLLWAAWAWEATASPVFAGVLCGVAMLARVDAAVLAALIGLGAIARRRWRDLVLWGTGALAVTLPWIVSATLTFGSPFPDSGAIKAHLRSANDVLHAARVMFVTLPRVAIPGRFMDSTGSIASIVLASLAVLLLAASVREAARPFNRLLAGVALAMAAAYAALIGASEPGALTRYLFPVWAIVVWLGAQQRWLRAPIVVAGLALLHAADMAVYVRWERSAPVQRTYVDSARVVAGEVLEDRVPPDLRVASFDAGALGYFAARPIVNLDGLANHDILGVQRACGDSYRQCLERYLVERDISVLVGGTAFAWTRLFPDWELWDRLYESEPLVDGSHVVVVRLPFGRPLLRNARRDDARVAAPFAARHRTVERQQSSGDDH